MTFYKRKHECAICNTKPLLDLDSLILHCVCCSMPVPQYILVSAYNRKKYLAKFEPMNDNEALEYLNAIKQSRKSL